MGTKISAMIAVTAGNLDDTALFETTDSTVSTRKATVAQLRVAIAASAIAFLSTVSVAGAMTMNTTLAVTGATTLTGALTGTTGSFSGTLAVTGNTTLTGTVVTGGPVTITGTGNIVRGASGEFDFQILTAGKSFRVINSAYSQALFTVSEATGNTAIAGTLAVTGATALTGALTTTAIISANGGVFLNRASAATTGINFYSLADTAWQIYMATPIAGQGTGGNITAPTGALITNFAIRSFVQNTAGCGWTFESGTLTSTTPAIVFEIDYSGAWKSYGAGTIAGALTVTGATALTGALTGTAGSFSGTLSSLQMTGTASQGLQFLIGGGTAYGAVGTVYSSAATFMAQNAVQQTTGVDSWSQANGGIASNLWQLSNGTTSLYTAIAGKATAAFATFWGTSIFSISATGALTVAGIATFNGTRAELLGGNSSSGLRIYGGNLTNWSEIYNDAAAASALLKFTTAFGLVLTLDAAGVATFASTVTAANLSLSGTTSTFAAGRLYLNATNGLTIGSATGATLDFVLTTPAGATIMSVATGTANVTLAGTLKTLGGATFLTTSSALTTGAGVAAGTITNAPTAGNPTKWVGINDNGTTRYIPAW